MKDPIEILLVAENDDDVRLAREALREARVRNNIQVVPTGQDALRLLRSKNRQPGVRRPHLILLDLLQSEGLAVLTEIKSDASLNHIPVILLTTSEATPEVLGLRAEADGYMTKPVIVEQLLKTLRTVDDFWIELVKLSPVLPGR